VHPISPHCDPYTQTVHPHNVIHTPNLTMSSMLQNTSLTMCPVHPSCTSTVLPNFTWRRHIMGAERQPLSSPYPPTHPYYHRPTHPPHYRRHTRHTLLHITLLPHTHLFSCHPSQHDPSCRTRPIVSETRAKRDQALHRALPRTRCLDGIDVL